MPFAENVLLAVQIEYPYSEFVLHVYLEESLTQHEMNVKPANQMKLFRRRVAKSVQKERLQMPIKPFVLARRITTFSFIEVSYYYHTLFLNWSNWAAPDIVNVVV